MKRLALAIVLAGVGSAGCTTVALTEHTRQQIRAAGDCRDEAVLNCLATVAADPDLLPSFGLYSVGLATFTDSATVSQSVTWAQHKRMLNALALSGSRTPKSQWTFDPTVEYEKLQAVHAACLWAVFGEEWAKAQYPEILGNQVDFLNQRPHFAVEYRLRRIPPGWLHIGSAKDVPPGVRYKTKKNHMWVWVMPEDHEAFAQFALTLQDIATQDVNAYYSPPLVIRLTTSYVTKVPDPADKTKATTITTSEYRMLKAKHKQEVENLIQTSLVTGNPIQLTRAQWLEYTELYTGVRSSATGTPAANQPARTLSTGATLTPPGNSGPELAPMYLPP